ncbi:MAG: TIGR04282 family arsenosugar biosynthesis glycosyltransferase [Flavobacteriaceae bacterium]|nr:TIGR04282 family arsenosugar biosynthesis glycosyltransferase [Flavobacteriaceae bacterium]
MKTDKKTKSANKDEVPAFAGTGLLIIFTRNPELGKCKTRLAKTIGDEAALEIYKFLLQHTVSITENLPVDVEVHYSEKVHHNDLWDEDIFIKKQQIEGDLGEKMQHAFLSAFKNGYRNVIIIGSDLYDITQEDLEEAFKALERFEYVLGPSEDGGYYLLGMNLFKPELFKNKAWGTDTVLRDTLIDLKDEHLELLEERNDIDVYDDIKDEPIFQQFLNKTN